MTVEIFSRIRVETYYVKHVESVDYLFLRIQTRNVVTMFFSIFLVLFFCWTSG